MGYELINGIYKKGRRGDRKTEGAQAVRDVASSHTLVVSCEDYLCIAEMRNGVSRQTPRRLHVVRPARMSDSIHSTGNLHSCSDRTRGWLAKAETEESPNRGGTR